MLVDGKDFIEDMLNDDREDVFIAPPAAELTFRIKKPVLWALLDKASHVIPTRDVMPVLKNFQIEAAPGRLRVTATDSELSVIFSTEMVEVQKTGVAVVPAKKLLDIIRESVDGDVNIRIKDGIARITVGTANWNLKLQGGADYPPLPTVTELHFATVDRVEFLTTLAYVRYAAAKDANRASLMSVNIKDGRVIACDGARLQQATLAGFPFQMQIPIGAVDDLVKLLRAVELETISVGESDNHLVFRFGHDVFIANKLTAKFPDMETQLLRPALENKFPLTANRSELLKAIKRVRINADPNTAAVALEISQGRLTVTTRDKSGNAATETIEAGWDNGDRTVVVNHAYLTDLINTHQQDTCTLYLGTDTKTRKSAVMLRDDEAGTTGVLQQMLAEWVTE